MTTSNKMKRPAFPYGAQYYRTPNPPPSEWAKDFATMEASGFTVVKNWVIWSWHHLGPDTFEWSVLDELMDLGQRHSVTTLINADLASAPYWLWHEHPECRWEASTGLKADPTDQEAHPSGGWPGLCFDQPIVQEHSGHFLTALASRYRDHPALLAFHAWNIPSLWVANYDRINAPEFCYCPATLDKVVGWLKQRYGSLEALVGAWHHRYTSWEQVAPPRTPGGYPDWYDWCRFRIENLSDHMRFRVARLREGLAGADIPIVSHGAGVDLARGHNDTWQLAAEVDEWGFSKKELGPYDRGRALHEEHLQSADYTRNAARGKPGWHAEAQPGQRIRGFSYSLLPQPGDIKVNNWTSLMAGVAGIIHWQFRPELSGPEAPGQGIVGLDGTPDEITETAAWFARFTNEHPELARAKALDGEVAILVLSESELFCWLADNRSSAKYHSAVKGWYKALLHARYQPDFAQLPDLGRYTHAVLPWPYMLERKSVDRLREWVEQGGTLISEAAPAHFIDNAYCSMRVPGLGLDEVFGVVQASMESVPSADAISEAARLYGPRSEDPEGMPPLPGLVYDGAAIKAGALLERLEPRGARVLASYDDGTVAATEHAHGSGLARLVGTSLGISYMDDPDTATGRLMCDLALGPEAEPRVSVDAPRVMARFLKAAEEDGGGGFLYAVNPTFRPVEVRIGVAPQVGAFRRAVDLVADTEREWRDDGVSLSLGARDGTVLRLLP